MANELKKGDVIAYQNTTSTQKFLTNVGPVTVVEVVKDAAPDLVVVTPIVNRTTRYGKKWYELKRGHQIAVTKGMAEDLARCNVILPTR